MRVRYVFIAPHTYTYPSGLVKTKAAQFKWLLLTFYGRGFTKVKLKAVLWATVIWGSGCLRLNLHREWCNQVGVPLLFLITITCPSSEEFRVLILSWLNRVRFWIILRTMSQTQDLQPARRALRPLNYRASSGLYTNWVLWLQEIAPFSACTNW